MVSSLARGLREIFHFRKSIEPLSSDDQLVRLAQLIDPDGGLPGKNWEERLAVSLIALQVFLAQGNTIDSGPFRMHVQKLLSFLHAHLADLQEDEKRDWIEDALDKAEAGQSLKGDWLGLLKIADSGITFDKSDFWIMLESALEKV